MQAIYLCVCICTIPIFYYVEQMVGNYCIIYHLTLFFFSNLNSAFYFSSSIGNGHFLASLKQLLNVFANVHMFLSFFGRFLYLFELLLITHR